MSGRTLLQLALPTTFGLKAARWLVAVLEGRRRLLEVRDRGLAAQLGGAAGTLASLGESGVSVLG
jgi:3-carboxy-cis,cis-muconate cycloisomerase